MKKINICLIKPHNYIHSYAFLELAELIYFSLRDLGFEVGFGFNQIDPNVKNILIGCHLLDSKFIDQVPKSTIILNTEQIHSDTTHWNKNIFAYVTNFEVWDYSKRNIEKLNEIGVDRAKLFKIGFQKQLIRLDKSKKKDVDVLFYGSENERRKDVLEKLVANGLKVKTLFGVYGKEKDAWVERSKLVLNLHYYNSQIFEIVRVFYLLTNSIAVVGEVNETTSIDAMYKQGIYATKYDDLVFGCMKLIKNDELRQKIQIEALNSISKYPQKLFTKEALDS
jgi:hypothetical protein